jgi:hypothetical protein
LKHNLGQEQPLKQPFRSVSGYAEALGDAYGGPKMHPTSPHFNSGHYDEEIISSEGDQDSRNPDRKQSKQIQDRAFKLS